MHVVSYILSVYSHSHHVLLRHSQCQSDLAQHAARCKGQGICLPVMNN